jgi:PAS domain S-box-containing protein
VTLVLVDAGRAILTIERLMPDQVTENALGLTEAWFNKLIETIDEGVGIIDSEGRLTYVNPRLTAMVGYTNDELIGRKFFEFMAPDIQEEGKAHLTRRQRGVRESYETRLRRKDGSEIWVQIRTNPLLDEQGHMIASLAMILDITERKETEERLRRSETLNRQIIEAVPGGIVLIATDGSILRANAEAERLLGLRFDPTTQVYITDFQHLTLWEDGTECLVEDYPVTRCLRTGEPQPPATIGVLRPDGQITWGIFTANPSIDPETGTRLGVVVTFVDITARKQAEEALREREELSRLAIENSPDSMFYQDVDLRFTWMSRIAAPVTPQDVIGHTDEDLLGPEEGMRLKAIKRHVLDTGIAARAQTQFLLEDGKHHFDVAIVRRTDRNGNALGIAGYARDVTERTNAEVALKALNDTLEQRIAERTESLAKQTQILQSVLNSMSDGVLVADEEGRVLMENPALERIAGAPSNQLPPTLEGRAKLLRFYRADKVTPYQAHDLPLARAVLGEQVNGEEMLVRTVADGEVWISVSAVPLRDDRGRPRGGVAVARDFTERKQADERLRQSEGHYRELAERNRLLAREVQHRVGNNLAGLIGLVSFMQGRMTDVNAFAAAIEVRLRAMAHVHQMLAGSGWGPVRLREVVASVFESMSHLALYPANQGFQGDDITVTPAKAPTLMLILVEWYTNSCKYGAHRAPSGRVTLSWEVREVNGRDVVKLVWVERGGPQMKQPIIPSLGTELVHAFAKRELGGTCSMTFPATGAEHMIEFTSGV